MQRRAESVRSEWARKVAETARAWRSIPREGDMPIQRRYRARPAIKSPAYLYGKWSWEVKGLIAELAKKGEIDARALWLLPRGREGH